MALLKNKKILLDSQFRHYDDPFYQDNAVRDIVLKQEMPSKTPDVTLAYNQAQFFSVENVLDRLLQNDRFINAYIKKISSSGLDKQRAKEAFECTGVTSLTSDFFERKYEEHLSVHHNEVKHPEYVQPRHVYTGYCHADFSNFDAIGAGQNMVSVVQPISEAVPEYEFKNDQLISCEFDDSPWVTAPTNYINIKVRNAQTDWKFAYGASKSVISPVISQIPKTSRSKYIYKEWLSGMKEFHIYIPSTFTFYNDQIEEEGHGPHSRATYIQVVINKRHFALKHIYQMQIQGQSLPLQISGGEDKSFKDCILPSLTRTPCVSDSAYNNTSCVYDENTNMFTLYFCCYGTDAQAIRILGD